MLQVSKHADKTNMIMLIAKPIFLSVNIYKRKHTKSFFLCTITKVVKMTTLGHFT